MKDRRIYPADLAERLKARAGQPYRPSNGTEGEVFYAAWCAGCARDAAHRADPALADGCPILAASMAFDLLVEGYPEEFQYGQDGQPCCTGFTTEGMPERCPHTADLFGGA